MNIDKYGSPSLYLDFGGFHRVYFFPIQKISKFLRIFDNLNTGFLYPHE